MGKDQIIDFVSQNEGTLIMLYPLSETAHEWAEENLPDDRLTFGDGIAIEPRYFNDIAEGLVGDGLNLQDRQTGLFASFA